MAMWMTLMVCERRVNECGSGLCLLNPTSKGAWSRALTRTSALGLALAVALVVSASWWPPLPLVAGLAVLVLLGPCAWSGWKNRHARRQLRALGPARKAVYVHSVARLAGPAHRGAGGSVLAELASEADARGWLLALDAGAPALVAYYERFGFTALGPPVPMSWGAAVRMARPPGATGA
ncbi:MAG TPA: hypothetical protein VHT30_05140 [Acidimicrobiales bacterium]|nr:hypothetical protein [Acidimicrobiales bacterium]